MNDDLILNESYWLKHLNHLVPVRCDLLRETWKVLKKEIDLLVHLLDIEGLLHVLCHFVVV